MNKYYWYYPAEDKKFSNRLEAKLYLGTANFHKLERAGKIVMIIEN